MKIRHALLFLIAFALGSCASSKKIVYFADAGNSSVAKIIQDNPILIKEGDVLSIYISSSNPELAIPFNIVEKQTVRTDVPLTGYVVDNQGFIDMPVLGVIDVVGMSKEDLATMLKEKLTAYLPSPSVSIAYLNFRITVLGEVMKPGSFVVLNERISILDALGMAGDLSVYGKRDNILVIREHNGDREIVRLDITSKHIFDSPYFYLQQNDVVYVEPNNAKVATGSAFRTNFSMYMSFASLLTTIATIIILK